MIKKWLGSSHFLIREKLRFSTRGFETKERWKTSAFLIQRPRKTISFFLAVSMKSQVAVGIPRRWLSQLTRNDNDRWAVSIDSGETTLLISKLNFPDDTKAPYNRDH